MDNATRRPGGRHDSADLGLGALAGVLMGSLALRRAARCWRHDVRVIGLRTSLTNVPRMIRIRYRAPLRRKAWFSPHAVGLYDVMLIVSFRTLWMLVPRRWSPAGLMGLAPLVAMRLDYVRTPTVLYLGASAAPNFSLLKLIQSSGPGLVLSAIDHAHHAVSAGRPLNRSSGLLARYFQALPGYDYPQPTSLRTKDGQWERTVRDLLELVPLVVLDAQILAPNVMQELDWVTSGGYGYKTIVVSGDATPVPLAAAQRFCAVVSGAASCLDLISRLTASAATRPTAGAGARRSPGPPVLQPEELARRRTELRSVHAELVEGKESDPDLDRRIRQLFGTDRPPAETDLPPGIPLTASLDQVLDLAAGWTLPVSLAIYLDADGLGYCEVRAWMNEAFVGTSSGARSPVPVARLLVAALVATALRLSGGPADDHPVLTAEHAHIVRAHRTPSQLRTAHAREDLLETRLRDAELRRVADALGRRVRSASQADADLDERLHALFAVEMRPETAALTASIDAALAFARCVGLSSAIGITVAGTAWAEIGGTLRGTPWRLVSERALLPPPTALTAEMLRLFRPDAERSWTVLRPR